MPTGQVLSPATTRARIAALRMGVWGEVGMYVWWRKP